MILKIFHVGPLLAKMVGLVSFHCHSSQFLAESSEWGKPWYSKSNLFQASQLAINVYVTTSQAKVSEYQTRNHPHRAIICYDGRSCLVLLPLKPVIFCTVQANCSKVHPRSCTIPSKAMTSEYDAAKRPQGATSQ